jgi:dTDP-glucose 4,6-dehydratase
VYGKQPNDVALLDEGYSGGPDPLFAGNAYHEGKRISELHCGLYAAKWGIRAKIARLFAFVGPFLPLDRHLAIGNFIRDGLQGGPIVLSGDGTTVRSYLYAADMIVWLWAIYARGMPGRSYNVGSEESIDLRTLAALVAGRFPKAPEVRVSQVAEKGRSLDRYVPSTLRIRRELGVEQSVPLTDAVDRTIEFYRAG